LLPLTLKILSAFYFLDPPEMAGFFYRIIYYD
jgi:hypothetical protein